MEDRSILRESPAGCEMVNMYEFQVQYFLTNYERIGGLVVCTTLTLCVYNYIQLDQTRYGQQTKTQQLILFMKALMFQER